jgi:hypothetical protein
MLSAAVLMMEDFEDSTVDYTTTGGEGGFWGIRFIKAGDDVDWHLRFSIYI